MSSVSASTRLHQALPIDLLSYEVNGLISGLIPALFTGLIVATVSIVALRPVAVAIDLVDRPGGRKTHHGEVPIVGGLAMLFGMIVGIAALPSDVAPPSLFVAACALLVILGLLDDRFELSAPARLVAHGAIVVSVALGSGSLVATIGDPFGTGIVSFSGWTAYLVTVIFSAGAINAFNMLDGMDGLAGAMSCIALCAFAWIGYQGGMPHVVAISFLMFGAVIGFLLFNLPAHFNRQVRCFMGDSGSTLLGFLLAFEGMLVTQGPSPAAAPILVLWIAAMPIYELLWTMIRRLSRGRSPFTADREHLHHLLLDAGFGVRAAFIVLVSFGVALASVGLLLHFLGAPDWASFIGFLTCGVGTIRFMYRAPTLLSRLPARWHRIAAAPIHDVN